MAFRLLMLNFEFPPIGGGAANAHYYLLKEYADSKDLTIDVLTSAPEPGFFEEIFSENINIYKVGLHKKNLHYWRKVEVIEWLLKAGFHYRRMFRQNSYNLVHAFFGFPTGWLCYRTADRLPYIISLRGSDVPGYNVRLGLDYKLTAGLFRKIWSSAAAVVANSSGLRNLALEFMPSLDIEVIPNGIDTEKFYPSEKQHSGKTMKLLTVSRLIERKRISLLIKAVSLAKDAGLDVCLNIAGEGNLGDSLRKLSQELNVSERTFFLGRIPSEKMPQIYRENDVFVMSSAHEGMSNAMLEAMASGLPIVTTECEGVDELIADNGIVTGRADAESFAGALKILIQDSESYKKMGTASRTKAEKLSWNRVARQYLDCYNKALDGNSLRKGL
jgi:glycosyltransferase involved in cell wall biosynthesis